METEARIMEYVRAEGYPVPAVDHLSDDGTDMVLERIHGPSMVDALGKKPWTLTANGVILGRLHRRLHEIAAPDWMDPGPGGEGSCLIHLDLHPLNVLLGPSGPVVIDWPNARRGQADFDVALSWVLMMAGEIPGNRLQAAVMGLARGRLVGGFLRGFDLGPVRATMRTAVEWKVTDPHMSEAEQRRMWDVVRRVEGSGSA
jgi:serine/threonine protein kinase